MSKKQDIICVAVTYSFSSEVVVHVFDDYQSACNFIKEDFENELKIDIQENGYKIDETDTVLKENYAKLATIYPFNGKQVTTWTIPTTYDKR